MRREVSNGKIGEEMTGHCVENVCGLLTKKASEHKKGGGGEEDRKHQDDRGRGG